MKRIFAMALALAMALSLTACGGGSTNTPDASGNPDSSTITSVDGDNQEQQPEAPSATPLELGVKHSIPDYADFTLVKIETTEKITAALGGMMSYSPQDGYTYIDVVADVTITSASAINSDDLATGIAKTAASEYDRVSAFIETGDSINQYEDLAPLSTYRVHFAFSVPKTETAADLTLNLNGSEFTYSYTMNEKVRTENPIVIGTPVENPDFANMTLTKVEYTEDLMPSNTAGYYTHYPVENTSNIYLALHFNITNLQSNAKREDTFVSATATYMDKYNYTGFVIVEDSDGGGFSQYEDISPLSERHFVCLIEVPKTVMENPAALDINFGGTEYTCEFSA